MLFNKILCDCNSKLILRPMSTVTLHNFITLYGSEGQLISNDWSTWGFKGPELSLHQGTALKGHQDCAAVQGDS